MPAEPNPAAPGARGHIPGLDAIRFVAAAIVALGHFPADYAADLAFLGPDLARLAGGFLANAFNGPAAVIVFFILSGLVIHLPYATGKPFRTGEYVARRYLRILPPVAVFVIIFWYFQGWPRSWNDTVLWSIVCEGVYYALYPLIRRFSFAAMTIGAFVLTLVIAALNLDLLREWQNSYVAFGYWTWVIGLPCWLSGCWLATRLADVPRLSTSAMWAMRFGIYALSVALRIAKFHAPGALASNVFTLTLFAIPAAVWIACETRYFAGRAKPWLDRLGVASYSLYLVHPLAMMALLAIGLSTLPLYLAAAAVAVLVFYHAVERTSHRAARAAGRALTRDRPVAA